MKFSIYVIAAVFLFILISNSISMKVKNSPDLNSDKKLKNSGSKSFYLVDGVLNKISYRMENTQEAAVDNSSTDDCMPKLMVDDNMLNYMKERFPIKFKACNDYWAANNGLPGKNLLEYYKNYDSQIHLDKCMQKQDFDKLLQEKPGFKDLLLHILPNNFQACQTQWGKSAKKKVSPRNNKPKKEFFSREKLRRSIRKMYKLNKKSFSRVKNETNHPEHPGHPEHSEHPKHPEHPEKPEKPEKPELPEQPEHPEEPEEPEHPEHPEHSDHPGHPEHMVDNSSNKDCNAKILTPPNTLEEMEKLYPLKYKACTDLWKTNDGMPGEDAMKAFAEEDKNFHNSQCMSKEEFEQMKKIQAQLIDLMAKIMPNHYSKCKELMGYSKKRRSELRKSFNRMYKINLKPYFRMLNETEKFEDNNSNKDCPPKLLVPEKTFEHMEKLFPLKYKACTDLWKTNGGMPGQDALKTFQEEDKKFDPKECVKKEEYLQMKKHSEQLVELLTKLMPNNFAKCNELMKYNSK